MYNEAVSMAFNIALEGIWKEVHRFIKTLFWIEDDAYEKQYAEIFLIGENVW